MSTTREAGLKGRGADRLRAKEGAESGEAKGLESSMLHSTAQSQISSISIHYTSESVEQEESSSPSTNKQLPN